MRPNKNGCPGVTLARRGGPASPYHVLFTHPLSNRRVKRSLETADKKVAKKLALILSMLLQTPSKWDDLPDNVPSVIKKIWGPPNGGYAPISNIDEYVDSAMEMIPKLREQILTLQIQLEQANALLAQVGNKSTNDHVPKTLEEALADYWRDNKQQRGD